MRISYATFLGVRYPMVFNLVAAEQIEERFGGLDGLQAALTTRRFGDMAKAVDGAFGILMDAGREYCQAAGIDCPPPLPCRPSAIIDLTDPEELKMIFAAISGDAKRAVEVSGKNGEATPGA